MAGTIEAYLLALTSTMGQGILGIPAATTSTGTATSGTTETLDAVLGTYQFNVVSGRRYQVVIDGLLGNGTVAGDVFGLRIRNSGSSSAPTSASTVVAESAWYCTGVGSAGRSGNSFTGTFLAGANGTNTIGFFAVRISGTGVYTPVSGFSGAAREMYAVDLGVF